MKKIQKIFLIGFLTLALVVGVGVGSAGATLTLDALTVTSSGALTLTGAAASAITVGAAAQTGTISVGDSTGAMTMNLASGNSIKTINLGTGTGVKTIHIGDNATPANVITIGGAASGTVVGGTFKIGTLSSTVAGSGLTINATTPRAVDINVDDNDVATTDTAVLLSAGRFRLMRYANSDSEDYAVHGLVKYSALTKSRFGAGVMGAAETTGAVTASNLLAGVLGRFGTAATLTLTGATDRVAAVAAFNNNSVALAGSGKSAGLLVMETDVGTPIDLDYGLEIQNSAATTGIQVGTATTGINLAGTFTTGMSVANTATTGINFAGGAATQPILVGAFSSTVPGSGVIINDSNVRAVDVHVDDNDVASADTAKTLSAARFRLIRYADSVAEDYALHGLVKYTDGVTKSRWGAGVIGAAEMTGAVTLSNLTTGVLGRFGTSATLTLTGATDRVAAVTAFNNNGVALAGSGKSAGLLVMETDVGTPIDLDYGLEIQNSAATTGIKIGTTTTDIELQNGETIINSPNGVIALSGGVKIPKDAASATNATIGTTPTGLTCDATTLGTLTWVDDTDTAGAWVWLCEQDGASSYAWKQLGI